jgi:hypothetical protein
MTFRTIHTHKQLKEDLAKAKADVEKTEKDLADAKNVITCKGSEVSTLKEQVKCVLRHLCLFVCMLLVFANVESCMCVLSLVCVFLWLGKLAVQQAAQFMH